MTTLTKPEMLSGFDEGARRTGLYGALNLIGAFALSCVLWYVFLHPNGLLKLYTPMYGFSLVVALVAAVVLLAKVADGFPFSPTVSPQTHRIARGLGMTAAAVILMLVIVYGFFWHFVGRFGITYFSPHAIIAAGGIGAEFFNARENASTAIVYLFAAFLWIALLWTTGLNRWPWNHADRSGLALARLATIGLLSTLAYVILFHPHVSHLFYPAQTMAGVQPWWQSFAKTSSAYFHLGWMLCMILWIVVGDILWEGWPWRLADKTGDGNPLRSILTLIVTAALGGATFMLMQRGMDAVWFEAFEGGQSTEAPYFRYLHAGEMAGFGILAAFIVRTYFGGMLALAPRAARIAARTAAAAVGAMLLYLFYYSNLSTLLLGKVPGVGQPEDTSLVWTLLFLAIVMIQSDFFRCWPLPPCPEPDR